MNTWFKPILFVVLVIWCVVVIRTAKAQTLDPLKDYRYTGVVTRAADGTTLRSTKAINAFKKAWACPSTKLHTGACAGWAIDHIVPLDCGGIDAVWNMQWLPDQIKSAQGAFTKDHFERRVYGGNHLSAGCP